MDGRCVLEMWSARYRNSAQWAGCCETEMNVIVDGGVVAILFVVWLMVVFRCRCRLVIHNRILFGSLVPGSTLHVVLHIEALVLRKSLIINVGHVT